MQIVTLGCGRIRVIAGTNIEIPLTTRNPCHRDPAR